METNSKQRAVGFVKNKLVSSLYKISKPSHVGVGGGGTDGAASTTTIHKPSQPMKKVPSVSKLTGFFGGSDDYVGGPICGGGDAKVDMKASDYISSFRERLVLEERNASIERVEMLRS